MKKIINYLILSVMAIVLLWTLISTGMTIADVNRKTTVAEYNKAGKIYVDFDVDSEDDYKMVKSSDKELISYLSSVKREVKYLKILMKKAKEDADKGDDEKELYEERKANYKISLAEYKALKNISAIAIMSSFFSYMLLMAALGIIFILHQRVEYKGKNG